MSFLLSITCGDQIESDHVADKVNKTMQGNLSVYRMCDFAPFSHPIGFLPSIAYEVVTILFTGYCSQWLRRHLDELKPRLPNQTLQTSGGLQSCPVYGCEGWTLTSVKENPSI